jgi:hypothetical protein
MVIYRLTDRIPCKIGELTFWLSPLSHEQKVNLLECKKMEGGQEVVDNVRRARLAMKYGIKEVEGVSCADGTPYRPDMDTDGTLSWAAVDEISELGSLTEIIQASTLMLGKFWEVKIEGVEFNLKGVKSTAKKD